MPSSKPMVIVPACNRMLGEHPFSIVGRKYTDAVRLAGCLPLLVPTHALDELDDYLDLADGIFLTGSPSNVHPSHFGESVLDPSLPQDAERDAFNLRLIQQATARDLPLFAICRGFQEVNVALGGSLYQAVHTQEGLMEHRGAQGRADASAEEVYAQAHTVSVVPGGVLGACVPSATFMVNSVHGQGVQRLAPGLRVEARSEDGLIEAFSMPESKTFNLCVQWHPEWKAASNVVSTRLLKAFGQACQDFKARHRDANKVSKPV